MDLSKNGMLSCNAELSKNAYGDTTLRLECFGYGGSISAGFGGARTNAGDVLFPSNAPDDGCRLVLGLGPTPSTYSDNKSKSLVPLVHQSLFSESDSSLKLGLLVEVRKSQPHLIVHFPHRLIQIHLITATYPLMDIDLGFPL